MSLFKGQATVNNLTIKRSLMDNASIPLSMKTGIYLFASGREHKGVFVLSCVVASEHRCLRFQYRYCLIKKYLSLKPLSVLLPQRCLFRDNGHRFLVFL